MVSFKEIKKRDTGFNEDAILIYFDSILPYFILRYSTFIRYSIVLSIFRLLKIVKAVDIIKVTHIAVAQHFG